MGNETLNWDGLNLINDHSNFNWDTGLAQMVDRPLCTREVPGATLGFSKTKIFATMVTTFYSFLSFLFFSLFSSCIFLENAVSVSLVLHKITVSHLLCILHFDFL